MALLAAVNGVSTASAQISVTPEQMRMFQNLSPEQRAAILQQLGGGSTPKGPQPGQALDSMDEMDFPELDMVTEEEPEELRVMGDVAVDVGTWHNAWRAGGGDEQSASGRYLMVWHRGPDGRWRIAYDMWHRPAG